MASSTTSSPKRSRNAILWDIMRTLRERTGLVFARNTAARAVLDWDEHADILAAVIDGDEELAALLATRHVRRAGQAAAEVVPDLAAAMS